MQMHLNSTNNFVGSILGHPLVGSKPFKEKGPEVRQDYQARITRNMA